MTPQIAIGILTAVIAILYGISQYFNSKESKKMLIKDWLKYTVAAAERHFGEKTGQLKLHAVYNKAVEHFPWMTSFVDFDTFSTWVDEALEWLDQQIDQNGFIECFVTRSYRSYK